jgi:hypothetical protein
MPLIQRPLRFDGEQIDWAPWGPANVTSRSLHSSTVPTGVQEQAARPGGRWSLADVGLLGGRFLVCAGDPDPGDCRRRRSEWLDEPSANRAPGAAPPGANGVLVPATTRA